MAKNSDSKDSMRRRDFTKLMGAAVAGLVGGGVLAGCAGNGKSGSGGTELPAHACAGKNGCKNQGGCKSAGGCKGKNDCKNQGGCATVEHHACAGKNACKNQGGCKSSGGCQGKNECKGQGGCKVPIAS